MTNRQPTTTPLPHVYYAYHSKQDTLHMTPESNTPYSTALTNDYAKQ